MARTGSYNFTPISSLVIHISPFPFSHLHQLFLPLLRPPRVQRPLVLPLGLPTQQVPRLFCQHNPVIRPPRLGGTGQFALDLEALLVLVHLLLELDALLHLLVVPLLLLRLVRLPREHEWLLQLHRHVLDGRRPANALRELIHPGWALRDVTAHADRGDIVCMQEVVPDIELVEGQGHLEGCELGRLGTVWAAEGYNMVGPEKGY